MDLVSLETDNSLGYTVNTTSSGLKATGVQVKDILPAGLTYDAATSVIPTYTTYTAATGIWDLSLISLASNRSIELKIAATVTTSGAIIMNKTEIFSVTQTDIDSTPNSNN
ncbi:MAG: hypothetical protein AB8B78_12145 [Polaribacter sp.]